MERLAGILAGVVAVAAYYFYIRDLLVNPKKDKSMAAWIIWTFIGFIILKSYLLVGGPHQQTADSSWVPLVYAVFPPVVLAILFFHCKSRKASFDRWDKACLAVSFVSLAYLLYFHEGVLPLHVNMVIDASGSVLVARNVWLNPGSEDFYAWMCFAIASALNLFAVQNWEYVQCVYPVLLFAMCTAIVVIIKIRPKEQAHAVSC